MQIKHLTLYISVLAVVSILLYSCASTGRPNGGPKDTDPPIIDTSKSTTNKQVRFEKQDLVFYFDEFVEVKDLFKQVVISPPLTYLPDIQARGKKVTFKFGEEEVLKEDATYTINFGEAIRDFRQGNILKNFRMVFSTGEFIDSLSIRGIIKDAFTGEPVEDVVVMLYDDHRDSIVTLEKPFYFSRTDKSGNFKIENIKEDTFKVFALNDENINYLYDLETEKIGYLDTLIVLNDSTRNFFRMELFLPKPKIRVISSDDDSYGKVTFALNTEYEGAEIISSDFTLDLVQEISEDSLYLFYETALDSFDIYIAEDTFKIRVPDKAAYSKNAQLTTIPATSPQRVSIAKNDTLSLKFSRPLLSFNQDSIQLQDTSSQKLKAQVFLKENTRNLKIVYPWKEGADYTLTLLQSALTDINGINNDTIIINIKTQFQDKLGIIHASFNALDSGYTYVALLEKGRKQIRKDIINISNSKISYTDLIPGEYQITTIRDENGNGKWDPGNYWNRSNSEKVRTDKLEKLRGNWELDAPIYWDPLAQITADSLMSKSDTLNQSVPTNIRKDQNEKGKKN